MRPVELAPRAQLLLHLAARVYHTTLLSMGQGPGTPYAHLRERGFTDQTIRRAGIGYATGNLLGPALMVSDLPREAAAELSLMNRTKPHHELMADCLVFVDGDRHGRILNLVGRKLSAQPSEQEPKYQCLNNLHLYGYARLDTRESQHPVLLVETPEEALMGRQWGFDALATVDAHLKEEHARCLAALPRPLILLPRNDSVGRKTAQRWQATMGKGLLLPLPDGVRDLSEMGAWPDGEARFVARLKSFGYERRPGKIRAHDIRFSDD
jgi:DNA primase